MASVLDDEALRVLVRNTPHDAENMWSATSTDFFNTIGQEPTWRLQFFAGGFATSRMRLIKSSAIGLGGANTFAAR